ncbi:MAG: adenine phosphoribosyltransferase [Candidatus Firestonebacteria bacterium]|nr:adenine phosphoribosyltransferase [Candidatus Firestonebacteria bacterium]
MENIKKHIKDVSDFPKKGIVFKDITPLLMNPKALQQVIDMWVSRFKKSKINKVVAMESRGFLFGVPVALKLKAGFVPVRKPGKLPRKTISQSFSLEYGKDKLEIHRDAIKKGDRVLIIDDVLATGGTAEAVTKLVEKLGGTVKSLAFLMELSFLNGRSKLKRYNISSHIKY